jgi:quercetin dioxygenase-like cupin family protein
MVTDSFTATEVSIPRGAPLPDFGAYGIEVSHQFSGKGYAKIFNVPAGVVIGQHRHKMGHDSHLILGSVVVTAYGQRKQYNAPAVIHIPALEAHQIDAVTDCLWACVWPDVDGVTDPEQIDHEVIA